MKALILNSGLGKRMGDLTSNHPKCMTKISDTDTILSRQLKQLENMNISEVVITTGPFDKILIEYCYSLNLSLVYKFVNNLIYDKTNYIYSIYLARMYLQGDVLLMHGDLVFEEEVLRELIEKEVSCVTVSSTLSLPEKDFKAVVENDKIKKIGIEFFENAVTAQPLYKLYKKEWNIWLSEIVRFCKEGQVVCYAENALNKVTDQCSIYPLDIKDRLCNEVDNLEDLILVKKRLRG